MPKCVYPLKYKQYIEKLIFKCLALTGHSEYTLRMDYSEVPDGSDTKTSSVKATVSMNTVYLNLVITVYPSSLKDWNNKNYRNIVEDIMHEVCHLFIEPVAELFMWDACKSQKKHYRNTIERQTERICKTIVGLCNDDWYLPEKL